LVVIRPKDPRPFLPEPPESADRRHYIQIVVYPRALAALNFPRTVIAGMAVPDGVDAQTGAWIFPA